MLLIDNEIQILADQLSGINANVITEKYLPPESPSLYF